MGADGLTSPQQKQVAATEDGEPTYFPAFIDLRGKLCIVVGGGEVAARKVRSLLTAGAKVRVIAPQVCAELAGMVGRADLRHERRAYADGDLADGTLVFAATDDREVNSAVYREALERGILVNSVDDPAHCTFIVPSQVQRDGVCIAISTQGQSPALARHLREKIERAVPPAYGELARLLGRLREEAKQSVPGADERARRWQAVIESDVLTLLEAGRAEEAEELARSLLGLAPRACGAHRQ